MALDNKITVKFIPDGDKKLIKAIEKLDSVHRKLTDAQQNLVEGGKRAHRLNNQHIIAYKRYTDAVKKQNLEIEKEINAQKTRNKQISTLRRSLQELGVDFKKAGISSKTHTDAIKGSRLALAKMDILTKRYIARMKQQEAGIFGLIGSNRLLGGSFAVLRSKLLLVSFAGTLVASTIGRLARQFGVQQDAERNLSTQLGHTNKELLKQASAIQSVTTHGDESLLMIMRFASTLGIQEKDLVKVTKASIGLSEAYGLDLRQSTRMLALATSGNTEMLNRYITELRNTTGESEKLAIISQKVTDGYRLHIARAGTLNFALDQMGNSVGDVAEKIGKILSPVVIFSSIKLREFADSFDDAKANRYIFVLGSMGVIFGVLRAKAIYATIAMNGFTASLSRTGFGALVVLGGILAEKILAMAGAFETAEEDIDQFNTTQKTANKLTKEQIDNIERILKLTKQRKKSIDDEIISLAIQEAELKGINAMTILEMQLGFEFVNSNKKRIESLINSRKRVKELKEEKKDALKQEEFERNQKIKIAEDLEAIEKAIIQDEKRAEKQRERDQEKRIKDLKSARDTIFQNDVEYQLKQIDLRAKEMLALGLNAQEQVALEKYVAEEKQKIIEADAKKRQKIIDESNEQIKQARADIHQNDLHYQFLELEAKRKHYESLAQTDEDRRLIEEFVREQQRELANKNLEENSALYNATLSSYDAFVTGLMDQDTNFLQTREAMINAFKESFIRFLADLIKEQIKAFLIEGAIRKASDKATEKDAMISGAKIFASYAGAAKVKAIATSGASVVSAGIATKAFSSQVDSMQKFEQGGLIGGKRHSQGGTIIEAEQGEFIMNRNAVEAIGIENLARMNQSGTQPVTINIQGNMVGNEEFVRDTLIPEINKTVNRGLA